MEGYGVPFILDTSGNVWAFDEPYVAKGLFKLPIPRKVAQLAPFVARTTDGHVYVWHLSEQTVQPSSYEMQAHYTTPVLVEGLEHISLVASDGDNFLAVSSVGEVYQWDAKVDKSGHPRFSVPTLVLTHPGITAAATDGRTTAVSGSGSR
jgi:hypothetical protein